LGLKLDVELGVRVAVKLAGQRCGTGGETWDRPAVCIQFSDGQIEIQHAMMRNYNKILLPFFEADAILREH
jgi:hypothetical protein